MRLEKGILLSLIALLEGALAVGIFLMSPALSAQDETEVTTEVSSEDDTAPEKGDPVAETTPEESTPKGAPSEEGLPEEIASDGPGTEDGSVGDPITEETTANGTAEPSTEIPEDGAVDATVETSHIIDETAEVEDEGSEAAGGERNEIRVTGSRIVRSNLEDFAQISVVTSEDIKMSGVTEIGMLLRTIPAVDLSSTKSVGPTNGGISRASLRNLGSENTLVLVNGRRTTIMLNDIPVSMIDRVEVLLDGASAIYGTDAMAGVVNVILKDKYEGLDVSVNTGISGKGDGGRLGSSITYGMAGDDGSMLMNLSWGHRSAIMVRDRDWAHPPCQSVVKFLDRTSSICGSPTVPGGTVVPFVNSASIQPLAPDGFVFQGNDGHFHPMIINYEAWQESGVDTPYDMYDWGQEMAMTSQEDKVQLYVNSEYEFNEYVTGYLNTVYSHMRTGGRYAGWPYGAVDVPLHNPFIPEGFWDEVLYRYGVDYNRPYVQLEKRFSDLGARVFDSAKNEFNNVIGLKGEVAPGYRWDVFFNYGRSNSFNKTRNVPDGERYELSIDPEKCLATPGCVIPNLFGEGVMQEDARLFIGFDDTRTWEEDMINGGAQITLEPFRLPGGKFATVIGGDMRQNRGWFSSDSKTADRVNGPGFAVEQTDVADFSSKEAFIELSAPLLAGIPGVDVLTINAAGRASNFKYWGKSFAYRLGLTYGPLPDIHFRGVVSTSFRTPSMWTKIGNVGFGTTTGYDPCANPGMSQYTYDQCTAAGAFQLKGYFPSNNDEWKTKTGVSSTLGPERSRSINLGTVIQPSFMPKTLPLSLTFDYYIINIFDIIGGVGAQDIVDNCYEYPGLTEYCDLITRDAYTGEITLIDTSTRNTGKLDTRGLDFTANLGFPLLKSIRGNFDFQGNFIFFKERGARPDTIGHITRTDGGEPRFRFVASLSFGDYWWSFRNRVRYVHGMDIRGSTANEPYRDVDAVAYWDMSASLRLGDFNIALGMDNVLDKEPPYMPGGNYNANIVMYDTIGRYIWTRLGYSFE